MTTKVLEDAFHLQILNLRSPNTLWELSYSHKKIGKQLENSVIYILTEKEVQSDFIFQSSVSLLDGTINVS